MNDALASSAGPVWGRAHAASDPVPQSCDDLVIGAGIVGLTTALLLAQAGRSVCVLEARHVGAGATGHSSAKVSLLQATRLSQLLRRHDQRVVQAYLRANREGFDRLVAYARERDVTLDRRPAVTFAADPSQVAAARAEFSAARSLGLSVRWADQLSVPFATHGRSSSRTRRRSIRLSC